MCMSRYTFISIK